jgi:microcystin-dependent protein
MEIRGIWPEEAEEIRDASVVDGTIDASGNLKLITYGGEQKNAGKVIVPLAAWPVGSIFMNVSSTSPTTLLGGGVWERFGRGRVLVGVDENDSTFNNPNLAGGAKTHTLTTAEMPSHSHPQNPHDHGVTVGGEAAVGATTSGLVELGDGVNNAYGALGIVQNIDIVPTTVTEQAVGGSAAHNNLQPYVTVYMWLRTS